MPKFEITISYSKTIDAISKDEAERVINEISNKSNLDDEYGAFSSLDLFTEVNEVTE